MCVRLQKTIRKLFIIFLNFISAILLLMDELMEEFSNIVYYFIISDENHQ